MTNQNPGLDQLSAVELREQAIILTEENERFRNLFITILPEILTPLTIIHSYGSLLLAENSDHFTPLDEKQTKAVKAMTDNATMIRELVNKSRQFGRREEATLDIHSSLVQDYRSELWEANQRLDSFEQRKEALHNLILNFTHDFYTPLTIIRAYTKLYQEKQFLPSDSLEKLIEIFESNAKLCLISFQLFRSAYATIYALYEDWNWQITCLDELLDPSEYDVQSEIEEFPPLRLPESFSQVFRLLWHTLNGVTPKKLSLVVREENAQLNLTIISDVYSSLFVYYIDLETNKVSCNDPRALSSICIANEFVKKVGGTMLMETDVKNGSVVTVILPVYQEES